MAELLTPYSILSCGKENLCERGWDCSLLIRIDATPVEWVDPLSSEKARQAEKAANELKTLTINPCQDSKNPSGGDPIALAPGTTIYFRR